MIQLTHDTILVVDDEEAIRMLVKSIVEGSFPGIRVESASDGEDALRQLRELRPLVMILDLAMPGKDGFEVLEELARQDADIPILLCSGYYREADIESRPKPERSKILFLPKPYTPDEMVAILRTMLSDSSSHARR